MACAMPDQYLSFIGSQANAEECKRQLGEFLQWSSVQVGWEAREGVGGKGHATNALDDKEYGGGLHLVEYL
jgi:hypothetical protein